MQHITKVENMVCIVKPICFQIFKTIEKNFVKIYVVLVAKRKLRGA